MPENKPVIGLTWEPKLPSFSSTSSSSVSEKPHVTHENISLYKPTSELLNGLYLPPNDPRKLNKLVRKQIKDTTGNSWCASPLPSFTFITLSPFNICEMCFLEKTMFLLMWDMKQVWHACRCSYTRVETGSPVAKGIIFMLEVAFCFFYYLFL